MKSILISGGSGDWAQSFKLNHGTKFEIHTPGRTELNVADPASVQAYFADKSFDIVINNAGTIHPKTVLESDIEGWINDINVNLVGTYLTSKAALHANANCQLIHISSTAAFNAYKDWSSYCASKAGVVTLSKSLAADGFNSVCLCPGAIDTKFRDKFNIANNNIMTPEDLTKYVEDVIAGQYQSGDVLFIRSNEFVLNP